MNIHACDVQGGLLWRFTQYGVCTSILAADLTGDGKMKIVGGPAKITCYSNCHVLNEVGKSISHYGNDGWASALTAICAADLDGNGTLEVVCGTNMNNVFALNAPEGKLALRWKYTAGDVINSLCAARLSGDQAQHVIAGSASEFVYALTGSGEVAWFTNLHDNVVHVAASDLNGDGRDEIVASTPNVVYILDAEGNIIGSLATESLINCVDLGEKLLIGTQNREMQELRIAN